MAFKVRLNGSFICWGLKEHFYDVIKLEKEIKKHFYEAFSDCLTVICGIRKKVEICSVWWILKMIFIFMWFILFIKYHIKLFVGIMFGRYYLPKLMNRLSF